MLNSDGKNGRNYSKPRGSIHVSHEVVIRQYGKPYAASSKANKRVLMRKLNQSQSIPGRSHLATFEYYDRNTSSKIGFVMEVWPIIEYRNDSYLMLPFD